MIGDLNSTINATFKEGVIQDFKCEGFLTHVDDPKSLVFKYS